MNTLCKNQSGQGLTEYVIIVALISIAAIAVVNVFGDTLRVNFAKMTNALQDKSYSGHYDKVNADTHVNRKGFSDMDRRR